MQAKYQVLIDGTDYVETVENWQDFLPVTDRHSVYHSHIASFAVQRIILKKAAKTYVVGQKNTKGAFASSTFVIKGLNLNTNDYDNLVNGSLDYKSLDEDVVKGAVAILFHPDDEAQNILSRESQVADIQELTDFNGDAITAFSAGPHNETYTLRLTKTDISGLREISTSNCEIMLPWEIALRLAQKIIGRNGALRSNLLGRTDGEVFQTTSDGALAFVALTNGGLIRGGTLANYSMKMSLLEFFNFINAITPISLGVELINGVAYLRIEDIDHQYDKTTTPVWTITDPQRFSIKINPNRVYGRILTGYRIFKKANDAGISQSQSFIDSMHTRRSYVTGLDNKSKIAYNVRTNAIASSYLMEIVRNNVIANNNQDETDQNFFYIVVKRSGGSFVVDNDQVSTTGVDKPATQKNYLLTPGRTILNHQKVFNAPLIREYKNREATEAGFTGFSPIKFIEGEGNKTASTRIGSEAAEISEDADLSAGIEPIFLEDDIFVETPISETEYKLVQANLKLRVNIVYDSVTYQGYIDQLKLINLNRVEGVFKRINPDY